MSLAMVCSVVCLISAASWHELHLEQHGHPVQDIDSLKYKQQLFCFVVVLSIRAASAWELLPEVSMAKT
jgi:hypothetical protein